jgi:hypothetical protein
MHWPSKKPKGESEEQYAGLIRASSLDGCCGW